ncbi:NADH-quinone oxidoreductase subunit M [Synechococcus sp. CS-197]|uniref:NADH-quinone oxidoreductase subunit M n=1 Tax=Synechococcus sp. CS-197 TaxID=2847985 RepID=UPI00015259ED|nr:NADH-quinone oxidoreductase subunit M [Synechococcus sp. CS-197]MCT0251669.1 NADH-quinone oxidoreductase subunit M [Synechococcus sp. CS-197]CAK23112.1 NAD(P)H-quinone oxidoreductase chain 4 [Synechococcus sp. WH 7803]
MLTILLLIPFLGALVISVLPSDESGRNRSLALLTLAVQCVVSFALLIPFQASETGQQLVDSVPWLPVVGLDFSLGVDGLSLPLVLMNAVLCLVAALASRSVENRSRLYFSLILVISGAVNGAFLAQNLLLFFIFYELELIPLWLLIAIWGGANRAYASTKFLIITAVSGVLILGAFLGIALVTGTADFGVSPILAGQMSLVTQLVLMGALLIGFGIKIPLFPFHTWLPDAHTEASTPVSVLLAGVLLKLGTYGLLRFCLGLFPEAWSYAAPWLAGWAAISVLYGSLAAIAQTDMKRMVAYSSVGHMGYVLLAAAAATPMAIMGALFQMVSHGLISAVLFLAVGVVYERTGTRDLNVLRGLLNPQRGLPLTGTLMIIGVMASAGIPGMAGFISEFLIFKGSFEPFPLATLLSMIGSGLTAVYFLLLVNRAFFGRLATASGGTPNPSILSKVSFGQQIPGLSMSVLILILGLAPHLLVGLSQAATTQLSELAALVPSGGLA